VSFTELYLAWEEKERKRSNKHKLLAITGSYFLDGLSHSSEKLLFIFFFLLSLILAVVPSQVADRGKADPSSLFRTGATLLRSPRIITGS
jgi:hypothetical protein